jgi:murein DD-endopeptidase MepM/ murein hydrolase activator NlpD
MRPEPKLTIREILGLQSVSRAVRQARLSLKGDAYTRPSRWDLTSLGTMHPTISVPTWLGRRVRGRDVMISNLFSHVRPPPEFGWSVRVTTCRDFRGKKATYDSHNGTDLAIPPGTLVVAPAGGVVLRVSHEYDRGALKVFIDHGEGLVTVCAHLARALVAPGQPVRRGEAIAWSGYSGLDALVSFPWVSPHVHFNTWLDGEPHDPFGHDGLPALWADSPLPRTWQGTDDDIVAPTVWDEALVDRAVDLCRHDGARAELEAEPTLAQRAMGVLFQMNYYPLRFAERPRLYQEAHPRRPRLHLPFSSRDFDGSALPPWG